MNALVQLLSPYLRPVLALVGGAVLLLGAYVIGRTHGFDHATAICEAKEAERLRVELARREKERLASEQASAVLARERERLQQILRGFKADEKPTGPACLGGDDVRVLRDSYEAIFHPDAVQPSN